MRTMYVVAAILLAVSPLANAETVIAEGHIAAGAPTTSALTVWEATGEEGVDSFSFDVVAGSIIRTVTTSGSALPYDIDLYFWGADGSFIGDCATEAADEVCEVPAGATTGEVAAFLGADLDVVVLEA